MDGAGALYREAYNILCRELFTQAYKVL